MILKICILSLILMSVAWSAEEPNKIVENADRHRGFETDVSFDVSVTDFISQKKIRESRYNVLQKTLDQIIVNSTLPENERGKKLLFSVESLWFYTPDIKRATRVSLQQRLTGEISNGDLAHANYRGDYDAKIISEEKINNRNTWKLRLTAKKKSVTYSLIIYWIEKETYEPVRAIFQTASGKALKFCEYANSKKILGRDLITQIKITDALRTSHYSLLNYFNYKKNKLDDSLFSKDALGND